jgi:hypothetical protein
MALANVLGFKSNDDFNRSLQCEKTDAGIDELYPKLNVENIAQFITLPPYADVRDGEVLFNLIDLSISAGEIFENGQ